MPACIHSLLKTSTGAGFFTLAGPPSLKYRFVSNRRSGRSAAEFSLSFLSAEPQLKSSIAAVFQRSAAAHLGGSAREFDANAILARFPPPPHGPTAPQRRLPQTRLKRGCRRPLICVAEQPEEQKSFGDMKEHQSNTARPGLPGAPRKQSAINAATVADLIAASIIHRSAIYKQGVFTNARTCTMFCLAFIIDKNRSARM